MASKDPKEAIIEYLSSPPAPDQFIGRGVAGNWYPLLYSGRESGGVPFKTNLTTLTFLKERTIPGRQLLAVAFEEEGEGGRKMEYIMHVIHKANSSWRVESGFGGPQSKRTRALDAQNPLPWVNLGSGGWPHRYYTGGHTVDPDSQVKLVRLIANNGFVLEDRVELGLVLFLSEIPLEAPVRVELYNEAEIMVNSYKLIKS